MTSGSPEGPHQPPVPHAVAAGGHRVIGAKHVRDGRPCQDDIRVVQGIGLTIVAVADGHGSSVHAEVGARIAVEVTTEALTNFVDNLGADLRADPRAVHAFAQHPFRVQLVREWARRVREVGGSEDVDLKEYGSTLLFSAVTPEFVLLGQLGDGDILVVEGSGSVSRPIPGDPTSFAEETLSLCLPEASSSLRVLVTPRSAAETLLLISTDGYAKSYATDLDFERIGPDYLEMVRELGVAGVEGHLEEFLTAVTKGGSGDDVALGLIYMTGRSSAAPDAGSVTGELDAGGAPTEARSETPRPDVTDPATPTANSDPGEVQ